MIQLSFLRVVKMKGTSWYLCMFSKIEVEWKRFETEPFVNLIEIHHQSHHFIHVIYTSNCQ